MAWNLNYLQTYCASRTLVSSKKKYHSDEVGAAPTQYLHTRHNSWLQWVGQRQLPGKTKNIELLGFGPPVLEV